MGVLEKELAGEKEVKVQLMQEVKGLQTKLEEKWVLQSYLCKYTNMLIYEMRYRDTWHFYPRYSTYLPCPLTHVQISRVSWSATNGCKMGEAVSLCMLKCTYSMVIAIWHNEDIMTAHLVSWQKVLKMGTEYRLSLTLTLIPPSSRDPRTCERS